ncbi:MAG: HAD-IIB family hydrolase [Erysipelotrichaceae bacterium]|nr:HAD-IIB family hydrolase [Erysipelotrichaceae bacterium]
MKKKIRLVAADIDRTLEAFLEPLPEINKKAMEALHEKGILFALASGRSVPQLRTKVQEWGLNFEPELLIGINGQTIYDGIEKKEESLLILEKEWVKEILDFLESYGYDYHAYIDGYTLFRYNGSYFYRVFKQVERDVRLADSPADFLKGAFYKFLLLKNEEEMKEVIERMRPLLEKHQDHFKILRTTPECHEIVHARASKAYPLKIFCERHNIALEAVAAFGDAENDNEMLMISGLGICLRDGEEGTKQIADRLTDKDCREGGFGDFVMKHILQ